MDSRVRNTASWMTWNLATWALLACTGYLLFKKPQEPLLIGPWLCGAFIPALSLICGWRAIKAGAGRKRWLRVLFWTPAMMGIGFIGLILWSRGADLFAKGELRAAATFLLIPLLTLLGIGIWERRAIPATPPRGNRWKAALRGWVADIALGTVCAGLVTALLGVAWTEKTEAEARRFQEKASAQWAQMGRPMPEFEKKLARIEENASLKELTNDLKPFGIVTLYKPSTAPEFEHPNKFDLPSGVLEISASRQPTDVLAPPAPKQAYLEQHAEELNHLYQNILRRDRPVWARNFADPIHSRTPDFLTLRKLSQLIAADAAYRITKSDHAGAHAATAAGLKITQNLGEQPELISCMIKVAINVLFARTAAWLPEDPQAWEQLATDAVAEREQLLSSVQSEACWATRVAAIYPGEFTADAFGTVPSSRWYYPLPTWAAKRYTSAFLRLEAAKNSDYSAEFVRIQLRNKDLDRNDLGEQEIEGQPPTGSSLLTPSYLRANARLNFVLLLREQAEMIRFARARMQEGKARAEHPSVVIPGAKWEVIGDLAAHSAALKLTPIPPWVTRGCTGDLAVIDDTFFLLPLGGSQSWNFAAAAEPKQAAPSKEP
ncbi:MAG: hypothetical protein PHQ12_00275 [Chthoniobacteraceae bacterium]|nr:hypothetical protein [Chthoniobacteraceae bacterium]